MHPDRLATLPQHALALDSETYRIEPGLQCPPIVCWSSAVVDSSGEYSASLLDKRTGLDVWLRACTDPDQVVCGANLGFDAVGAAAQAARLGLDIIPQIHKLYAEGRVFDVQHAEGLNAIAQGLFLIDPLTRDELKKAGTNTRGHYSLENCVRLVLGRIDAKENDEWKLRYGELDDVPMDQWPHAARQYPKDDAVNTLEVALAQAGHVQKVAYEHDWIDDDGAAACAVCGPAVAGTTCRVTRPHQNLMDLAFQARTDFALKLAGAHGFKTDQTKVDVVEKHAIRAKERGAKQFIDAGILREDRSANESVIKKMVAVARGCTVSCSHCDGTGKITSPSAKPIRCKKCKNGTHKVNRMEGCDECDGRGMRVYATKSNQINCCLPTLTVQDDQSVEVEKEKTCCGTGLVITNDVSRTETGDIGIGRDDLYETGEDVLIAYAAYCEDDKILANYIVYLREGRRCLACRAHGTYRGKRKSPHREGCSAPGYYGVPLNLGYNVFVETRRVSARGSIHQFPRKPGYFDEEDNEYVPSLRECIVPRCATTIAEVPLGYVPGSGEEILPW